jgi:uncharacterized protein (DUF433 family)
MTFLELVELLFVRLFREQGVSMQTIRAAAAVAASRFKTPYPFAVKRFDTDGKRIFATLITEPVDREIIEELPKGQLVFEEFVRPLFRRIDYRGKAEALRYWPLGHEGRVVIDPAREFGKPIDAETGVPTYALFRSVAAGDSRETVANWYRVPVQAVESAVKYERLLRAA